MILDVGSQGTRVVFIMECVVWSYERNIPVVVSCIKTLRKSKLTIMAPKELPKLVKIYIPHIDNNIYPVTL